MGFKADILARQFHFGKTLSLSSTLRINLRFNLLCCLVLGPLSFDPGDRSLQPVLNVLPQFLFGLRRDDRIALLI